MERYPPRRTGSSRFLIPPSSPAIVEAGGRAGATSPLRRSKPIPDAYRRTRATSDDASSPGSTFSLWPSASKKAGTLADHFGNDRFQDLAERRNSDSPSVPATAAGGGVGSLTRQEICSEFARLDDDEEKRRRLKENRPIGASMRYIGKFSFPRSSSKLTASSPSSSPNIAPARMSVDEKALALRRSRSEITTDIPSSESEPRIPATQNHKPKLAEGLLPTSKFVGDAMIRRSNSYRSSTTQWALSPGRSAEPKSVESPPTLSNGIGRSLSNLRPSSPGKGKGKGVGNFISSLGFDLFRRKPSAGASSPSSPARGGGIAVVGEAGHQFRLLHNRLIQWRYLNARSDTVNHVKSLHAETTLLSAWADMSRRQSSVAKKRVQLEKEKLGFKLNTMLSPQMKALEEWGDMERRHSIALAITKDCLQSVVCRVPLNNGVKIDPQPLSLELQQASNVVATIKTTISTLTPMAQSTSPLLSELAQVVTKEKSLLEEGFELLRLIATLQIQEQSLKCHLIQLDPLQQQLEA